MILRITCKIVWIKTRWLQSLRCFWMSTHVPPSFQKRFSGRKFRVMLIKVRVMLIKFRVMSKKFHRILNMISINCMSVSLVTCYNIQLICFENKLSLESFVILPYCFWKLRNGNLILGLVSRIFSTLIRNPNVLLPFLPPK